MLLSNLKQKFFFQLILAWHTHTPTYKNTHTHGFLLWIETRVAQHWANQRVVSISLNINGPNGTQMYPVLLIAELATLSTDQQICSVSLRCLSWSFAVHLHKVIAVRDLELLNIVLFYSRAQMSPAPVSPAITIRFKMNKYFSDFSSCH